jgi:hypothetical protein
MVGIFEISHLKIEFGQKEVKVIYLWAVFKDIFSDLNGGFYSLNGQIILAQFFKTDGAIDNRIDQSSIVHIFLPYLNTLVVLLFRFVEQLVFVKVVCVLEQRCTVLDLAVVFFDEFQVF